MLRVLPKNKARALAKIDDNSEFLRRAALEGAIDVDNLYTGAQMRDFTQELFVSGLVPESSTFTAFTPHDMTFFGLATSRFMAKVHPELRPLTELTDSAAQKYTLGLRDQKDFIDQLMNTIAPKAANRGVAIIEASADAGGVSAARRAAITAAEATGDEQVISFVRQATERLNHTRLRWIAAGRLGGSDAEPAVVAQARKALAQAIEQGGDSEAIETLARALDNTGVVNEMIEDAGLAGYFPIVHTGKVRVDINGVAKPEFVDSFMEARALLAREGKGGFISNAFATDIGVSNKVSGREFGRMVKAIREADGVEISAAEAAEMLKAGGTIPTAGPRKYSRHMMPRRLGTRDFGEDPFRTLDLYLSNAERTLALNTLGRDAQRIIDNIPAAKGAVKAWAEEHVDLMLGKPTRAQKMFSSFIQNVAPEVSQDALMRYSAMLRRVQGLTKLGGVWSGVVNATQFAVNSVPILGVRWATEGLRYLHRPNKREAQQLLAKYKVDLGFHAGITREGQQIAADTVYPELKAAIQRAKLGNIKGGTKAALQAAENMWMYSFNSAERFNRYATFWGAFKKGLHEGMDEEGAVHYAKELVTKTQFDYGTSNIPVALQGPVAAVLGQFKTFFINEIELIATLDKKTLAKMMLSFQAVGGVGSILALPGIDLIDDHLSRYFFDVKASEAIKLEGGKDDSSNLSRFLAFGVPGMLPTRADLTNYVGPGGFSALTMGLLGPTVSDLQSLFQFSSEAAKDIKSTGFVQPGTINNLAQRIMPAQVRRYTRGSELMQTGEMRNAYSGKLIYRPDERVRAGLREMIGMPTIEKSVERLQDDIVDRQVREYRRVREGYRRQIALASVRGNTVELQRLLQQASANGYNFSPADVRRAVEAFSMTSAERRQARTPRDMRTEFEEFFGL